jgi:hypothetical protein
MSPWARLGRHDLCKSRSRLGQDKLGQDKGRTEHGPLGKTRAGVNMGPWARLGLDLGNIRARLGQDHDGLGQD